MVTPKTEFWGGKGGGALMNFVHYDFFLESEIHYFQIFFELEINYFQIFVSVVPPSYPVFEG